MKTTWSGSVATERRHGDCGCGCGGDGGCGDKSETCCGLDCITAPRFFSGQLLTDDDLGALVDWTRAKTRLTRHRDGWGVVCGLDVHCDAAHPGSVVIAPGYAVGCCGDDIVVCEETRHDLSAACRKALEACDEQGETARARPVDRPMQRTPHQTAEDGTPAPIPFDLSIAYAEAFADARTALARGAGNGAAACEHARVRETFTLTHAAGGSGDPVTAAADRWRNGYDRTLAVLDAFQDTFSTLEQDEAGGVRSWLLRWIAEHPLHHFCFVREQVCALDADETVGATTVSELLFWLAQDSRNAFLNRACHECRPGGAVPLARVWLTPPHGNVRDCHVAGIDPYWPYRRELAHAAYPAPRGAVNLAQLLWHQREEACVRLADLGVEIAGVTKFEPPEDLAELRSVMACSPFAACGEQRRMLVHDAAAFGERVIGFCPAPAVFIPPPAVRLEKTSDLQEGLVGHDVQFTFTVFNIGDEDFSVSVDDDQLGFIGSGSVAAGTSRAFTKDWTVPRVRGSVINVATAVADGPGGCRSVEAKHSFSILNGEPEPEVEAHASNGRHDMQLIEGIGPAREVLLVRNGIRGLAELAEADSERIAAILGGGPTPNTIERWRAEARELLAR